MYELENSNKNNTLKKSMFQFLYNSNNNDEANKSVVVANKKGNVNGNDNINS